MGLHALPESRERDAFQLRREASTTVASEPHTGLTGRLQPRSLTNAGVETAPPRQTGLAGRWHQGQVGLGSEMPERLKILHSAAEMHLTRWTLTIPTDSERASARPTPFRDKASRQTGVGDTPARWGPSCKAHGWLHTQGRKNQPRAGLPPHLRRTGRSAPANQERPRHTRRPDREGRSRALSLHR